MVRKRRFFPKKRRVSGAETSFFDPKDFVFFRKNAVFSYVDFFFVILKVSFTLEITPKFGKIHAGSLISYSYLDIKSNDLYFVNFTI